MRVEHDAVRRELARAGLLAPGDRTQAASTCTLVQTGIGKSRVVRSLKVEADQQPRRGLFVLAGACGGLRHTDPLPTIARVIDQHGHTWTCGEHWTRAGSHASRQGEATAAPPTSALSGRCPDHTRCAEREHLTRAASVSAEGVTLIGVDEIIATPADKSRLAERTGAAIVDMESHAFIEACERLARESGVDVHWSIVRGVSDTPDETLPAEVLNWIDGDGNTRTLRAVRDLALRPRLVPHMVDVLRRSQRVLPLVGERVVEVCRAWQEASEHAGASA